MNSARIKKHSTISAFKQALSEIKQQGCSPDFVPTGLQEDIIHAVGCGKYQIVVAIDANRVGKTTTIINIAKQIIWPEENEYFDFWEGNNVFKKWPYQTKRFRIGGTPTNLADNGAIQQALEMWWPRGKYEKAKGGKHHYSVFKAGEWEGDALTYEQSASEWEGQTLSLVICDEPPKSTLIGAINSRMAEGGIWVIGMTPINCGVFLDTIDDLEEKGKRVVVVTGSVYDNDVETGKANHNNTKRGLWTKDQITDFVAGIPLDERDARIEGKASHKSGKIYPMFDQTVHCINFNYANLAKCNCYMVIDPHRKYYPAILWFAVTPSNCVVIYNEYPKFDDLKAYYAEVRNVKAFSKTNEELADIIKANDLTHCGAVILSRALDPHYHNDDPEFIVKLQELGVGNWIVPDCEKIEVQRRVIADALNFNPKIPIVGSNTPMLFIDSRCKNASRAASRHYWEEGKDKESEEYKDFCDVKRYFYSIHDGRPTYIMPERTMQGQLKSMASAMLDKRPVQGYYDKPKK